MCGGSTDAQNQLQQEQLDAYKQMLDMTKQQYANQQEIYAPMVAQFQSILSKGPSQQGFSAEQRQNLDAGVVERTAENYKAAATAVGESIASMGGGTNPLPSGSQTQLRQQTALSAAQQKSADESRIAQADYQQGYQEWLNAGQGLESIAAGENPLGYANASTSAGSAAGTTAEQIQQADNSWLNAAIGAVSSVGAGWASGGFRH